MRLRRIGPRLEWVIGIAATPGVTKVTPYIRLFCLAAGDKAEIQSIACKQAPTSGTAVLNTILAADHAD